MESVRIMEKEVEIVIHFTDEYFELLDEDDNRLPAPDDVYCGTCREFLLSYRKYLDPAHRKRLEEHLEQLVTMIENWMDYVRRMREGKDV